jgi:hypothetical protein
VSEIQKKITNPKKFKFEFEFEFEFEIENKKIKKYYF